MVEGWREVPRRGDQEHEVDDDNQCCDKVVGCCVPLWFGSQWQPAEELVPLMEQARTPVDNPPHNQEYRTHIRRRQRLTIPTHC
jgi:hypothetical protein